MCAFCQTQCPSCCWVGCQHDGGGIGYTCKRGKLWRHVVCRLSVFRHHPLFGHPLFGHPLFVGGNLWCPLQISLWEDPFVPGVHEATFGISIDCPAAIFFVARVSTGLRFFGGISCNVVMSLSITSCRCLFHIKKGTWQSCGNNLAKPEIQ